MEFTLEGKYGQDIGIRYEDGWVEFPTHLPYSKFKPWVLDKIAEQMLDAYLLCISGTVAGGRSLGELPFNDSEGFPYQAEVWTGNSLCAFYLASFNDDRDDKDDDVWFTVIAVSVTGENFLKFYTEWFNYRASGH